MPCLPNSQSLRQEFDWSSVCQRVLHGNSAVPEEQGHVVEKWQSTLHRHRLHEGMTWLLAATPRSWNCVLEDGVDTHK
jgi:hypothetical protein